MNTQLLAPALQRIINAVDSLPGRKGQHVPKVVLDAVEELRSILNPVVENGTVSTGSGWSTDFAYGKDGSRITRHEAKFVWEITEPPDALAKQLLEQGFTFHLNGDRFTSTTQKVEYVPPSKQRITLRGGPLDGTWHWVTTNGNAWRRDLIAFEWTFPDGQRAVLQYSAPNGPGDGNSYYRGIPVCSMFRE